MQRSISAPRPGWPPTHRWVVPELLEAIMVEIRGVRGVEQAARFLMASGGLLLEVSTRVQFAPATFCSGLPSQASRSTSLTSPSSAGNKKWSQKNSPEPPQLWVFMILEQTIHERETVPVLLSPVQHPVQHLVQCLAQRGHSENIY